MHEWLSAISLMDKPGMVGLCPIWGELYFGGCHAPVHIYECNYNRDVERQYSGCTGHLSITVLSHTETQNFGWPGVPVFRLWEETRALLGNPHRHRGTFTLHTDSSLSHRQVELRAFSLIVHSAHFCTTHQ